MGIHPALSFRIWLVKVLARVALALVWIHEGLIPKILFVRPSEPDLVAQPGLVLSSPQTTLALLGVFEAIVGTWFLFGRAERSAALGMSLAAVAIAILVVAVNPSAWTDPFGGISKSLGLLACGAAVWFLSPVVPHAHSVAGFAVTHPASSNPGGPCMCRGVRASWVVRGENGGRQSLEDRQAGTAPTRSRCRG